MSLSEEERRVSLSQEESVPNRRGEVRVPIPRRGERLPNHLGKESRLLCTTDGEGGSKVHRS